MSGDNAPLLLPLFFSITISDLPSLTPALYFVWPGRFFHFYIFQNYFLQKYIFGFTIYRNVPLPPGRGGRGLYAIKIFVLSHGGPYRPAGGRQAPTPNIKAEVPPRPPTPAFAANNIHRGKKERRGVREGVATTKHYWIPHL